MMSNRFRFALLSSALSAAMLAGPLGATEPAAPVPIATVNGVPYALDVFRMFYIERLQQTNGDNTPAQQEIAFNDFMGLIVAAQEAERRELTKDPEILAAIELERMRILSQAALMAMAEELDPSEAELREAYERIKASTTRTEYKARHILLKEEDEAKRVIAELDGGADFTTLATQHSLGPTAPKGGDLDWFDANQMVAPFAEAVAAMETSTYTKTPVHTQFGWHVIYLEDTRQAEPPNFEDSKPQLEAIVRRAKLGEALAAIRDSAMVDLNEEVVRLKPDVDAGSE